MNNACLVIPHFGDLNRCNYLSLFLATVKNKPFDVLLFTDFPINDAPPNIKIHKCTIDDIYNKAEKIIGKIETRFYYKLCDLRVIYGEMFKEELRGYDYWGWGDLDVMYGNFEKFPKPANGTPDLFCNYHKRDPIYLVQSERPLGLWYASGHFVMMRNDDRSRRLINHLPTAERLIKDKINRYIDEHLVPTVLMHQFKNVKKIHSTDIQYVDPDGVEMKNQRLYASGKELNYIHWYTDKEKIKSIEDWRCVPDDFKLTDYYEC